MIVDRIRFWIRELGYRFGLAQTRRLLRSRYGERALTDLGIPGIGTHLVRYVFPMIGRQQDPRGGDHSLGPSGALEEAIALADDAIREILKVQEERRAVLEDWSRASGAGVPVLDNEFFGLFDSSLLDAVLAKNKPKRYVEIGSGFSTLVARASISASGLDTRVICIDPQPRADVADICDELIRQPFQNAAPSIANLLTDGDVVMFDGSHHAHAGSDVTCFFFELIPSLPTGVICGVHDIYLPWDYASDVAPHYWSEQYLLAGWIMGGSRGLDLLYPAYFATAPNGPAREFAENLSERIGADGFAIPGFHRRGTTCWLRVQ